MEPSHNPVYVRDVQPEDMYTLPKKVPIHHVEETHMVVVPPVIVPAEEELVYPPPEVRYYEKKGNIYIIKGETFLMI